MDLYVANVWNILLIVFLTTIKKERIMEEIIENMNYQIIAAGNTIPVIKKFFNKVYPDLLKDAPVFSMPESGKFICPENGKEEDMSDFEKYLQSKKIQIGTFKILFCKSALKQFKKNLNKKEKNPFKISKPRLAPSKKRVNDFWGDSTRPYVTRKSKRLIENKKDREYAGIQKKDWWVTNQYGVKVNLKPKHKRPLLTDKYIETNPLFNPDRESLNKGKIRNEKYSGHGPEDGENWVEIINKEEIIRVNPTFLDNITTFYPYAVPYCKDHENPVYFYSGDDLIGLIMPLKD